MAKYKVAVLVEQVKELEIKTDEELTRDIIRDMFLEDSGAITTLDNEITYFEILDIIKQ